MHDDELKTMLAKYLSNFVTESRLNLFHAVLAERTRFVKVLLEGVEDPVDACAVLRSCECFGIQDVELVMPKGAFTVVQGAAVGASKWLTARYHDRDKTERVRARLAGLKEEGYRVAAVTPRGVPIHDLAFDKPVVLCFGEQPAGLGKTIYEMSDTKIGFPTVGFNRTFNISVCVALCLSSIMKRLRGSALPWPLKSQARLELEIEWLAKMPKRIKLIMERFLAERGLTLADLRTAGVPEHVLNLMDPS